MGIISLLKNKVLMYILKLSLWIVLHLTNPPKESTNCFKSSDNVLDGVIISIKPSLFIILSESTIPCSSATRVSILLKRYSFGIYNSLKMLFEFLLKYDLTISLIYRICE